ncbi:SIRBL protein, partial [Bucco capensis]|nr:SIRBL protein [Bucco capensis]
AQQRETFQLQQPQDKVSVTAGDTLTLTCTTTGYGPPGPVQWLKGWGSENKTIYDGQTGFSPRVTRVVKGSNTDFSIHIRDVQPEDAGTYYCVKYSRAPGRGLEMLQHGSGTEVSLQDTALVPSVVTALIVLCFLLLLSLLVAFCMYQRKHRAEAASQCSLPTLQCCAGTPGTPSEILDAETSHLPSQ